MMRVALPCGRHALLDDEDFARLGHLPWRSDERANGKVYAVRFFRLGGRQKKAYMHREILQAGRQVDHHNNNGLDNRRENLRDSTQSQNMCNRGRPASNTSGHKGVSWNKEKQKWEAYVGVGGRRRRVGYFSDLHEAVASVRTLRETLHQEYCNHGTV